MTDDSISSPPCSPSLIFSNHGARLLGLRIDVDTHEGMKLGVPHLLQTLRTQKIKGTFYLAMGPDNSGRAIFNLFRPGFVSKMRKSGAAKVYGLRTMLSGTLLPARMTAVSLPKIAREITSQGHEAGVHAWNHRRWQDHLLRLSKSEVEGELSRARQAFVDIFAEPPRTFAAPAWLSSEVALAFQESFHLTYASDCRGTAPFVPIIEGQALVTPQVPTTLPTLDEALGVTHSSAADFYAATLKSIAPETWPVLTIHAELEGGPYAADFDRFLIRAHNLGVRVMPLVELYTLRMANGVPLPTRPMTYGSILGRHGVVSMPTSL